MIDRFRRKKKKTEEFGRIKGAPLGSGGLIFGEKEATVESEEFFSEREREPLGFQIMEFLCYLAVSLISLSDAFICFILCFCSKFKLAFPTNAYPLH